MLGLESGGQSPVLSRSLSASAVRWDSLKSLVSFFSLNLLDGEIFLSNVRHSWGPLLPQDTVLCCCHSSSDKQMGSEDEKERSEMFVPVHRTHGIPKCWQVLLLPGSVLGLADLIPAFQAQAQNTQSRLLVCDPPSSSFADCLIIKSVQKIFLSDKAQSWLKCKVNWKLLECLLHGDKRLTSLFTASPEEGNWSKFFSSTPLSSPQGPRC